MAEIEKAVQPAHAGARFSQSWDAAIRAQMAWKPEMGVGCVDEEAGSGGLLESFALVFSILVRIICVPGLARSVEPPERRGDWFRWVFEGAEPSMLGGGSDGRARDVSGIGGRGGKVDGFCLRFDLFGRTYIERFVG